MSVIAARLRLLRSDERGVTMYLVIGLMAIAMLLMTAVVTATTTESRSARRDLDAKKATYAAQAGISAYLQALNANPNYWNTCPTSSGYSTGSTVAVPNSSSGDESYSYAPIPAPGHAACDPSNPVASMVASDGTFRVQFNGYSGVNTSSTQPVARSMVVQFKHESFLNYVWFTEYEQQNPSLDTTTNGKSPSQCAGLTVQQVINNHLDSPTNGPCTLINWVTGDSIYGPMFSDDNLYICGQPKFGTQPSDLVYTQGLVDNSGCSNNSPYVNTPPAAVAGEGTLITSYSPLQIPQSNDTLEAIANPTNGGVIYNGYTQIQLGTSAGHYTVTNANINSGTPTPEAYPTNGVIYVADDPSIGCSYTYSPNNENYTEYQSGGTGVGCGTATVQGTYDTSLTIASSQDVIVTGNLISGGANALLGLVPQNWARVYHRVMTASHTVTTCAASNNSGINDSATTLTNPTIDAAILTTGDSWVVDNNACGAFLGNLTINGALAQYYRGVVGVGGSGGSGYLKDYHYDTRLSAESPPYFLSPLNPAWSIQSEAQCSAIGHLSSANGSTAMCH
jgi:hypothetical protein